MKIKKRSLVLMVVVVFLLGSTVGIGMTQILLKGSTVIVSKNNMNMINSWKSDLAS